MSCAECRDLFASGLEGANLQIEVDTRFPNFACEGYSISEFSPGPVKDDEDVVFLTIHPIHYDEETGTLLPTAFQQLTRNDLSVLRRQYATKGEFEHVRAILTSRGSKERSVDQCCVVAISEIRGAKDRTGRSLGVYDTALGDIPAHASVFVRRDFLSSPESRLEARRLALSIFEPHLVPLETILP